MPTIRFLACIRSRIWEKGIKLIWIPCFTTKCNEFFKKNGTLFCEATCGHRKGVNENFKTYLFQKRGEKNKYIINLSKIWHGKKPLSFKTFMKMDTFVKLTVLDEGQVLKSNAYNSTVP